MLTAMLDDSAGDTAPFLSCSSGEYQQQQVLRTVTSEMESFHVSRSGGKDGTPNVDSFTLPVFWGIVDCLRFHMPFTRQHARRYWKLRGGRRFSSPFWCLLLRINTVGKAAFRPSFRFVRASFKGELNRIFHETEQLFSLLLKRYAIRQSFEPVLAT